MESIWFGVPAVGIIIALVELAKRLGVPSQYGGLLAIIIGVAGGVLAQQYAQSEQAQAIALGLLAALGASGLYSTAKNASGK